MWPIIQEFTYVSLEPIPLDIDLRKALSLEKIRVNVPCVFTVGVSTHQSLCEETDCECRMCTQVGTTPELMENTARRLVGLTTPQIANLAVSMSCS